MKYLLYTAAFFFILLSSCQTKHISNKTDIQANWFNVAVAEDVEIYTDTVSIRFEGALAYAREKRVYITSESKKLYVDRIRTEYIKMGKPEKADKWNDFSYCIYESEYDCTNKRFRVLTIEDFDSTGKRIAKTTSVKKNLRWLNVENETVGDYTFFFVCDYQQ